MAKGELRDKVIIRKRLKYALLLALLIFIYLTYRLITIMFIEGDKYKTKGIQQWTSDVKINAKRGRILDRDENELAISANVYRVDLDLNTLRDSLKDRELTMKQIAPDLANILSMDNDKVLDILTRPLPNGKLRGAAILKRRIEKEVADEIKSYSKSKEIRGVVVSPDTKRYYPNENFASHVIGHTNSDGDGLTGIELYYNKYLSGMPGIKISETDKKSEGLSYTISDYSKPIDGRDVVLTIDEKIQFFAEKAAEQALSDNDASAVSVLVMDPNTGEVLAMANKPDYNLNKPWPENLDENAIQKSWRNRAVSDTFEPGSIFKVVTATAALETGVVKESDTFHCGGSSRIGGRTIRCWKTAGHGSQTFQEIIKNSCNVGFMALGERLGRDNLNKYITKYGFGQKTGIDLPGEAKGIIKPTESITNVDLATISFGQSNTVSAIQFMTAFNAIANGGKLITPHLMKEVIHYDENNKRVVDQEFKPKVIEGNFKPEIMADMRRHLEAVVESGGSSKAHIAGYHIGGKTGTAQKVDPQRGGYGAGKYISSFAAMAPANEPKVTVFLSIDEPNPSLYYAGQIAAPAGKGLFYDIFNYLGLKPDATSEEVKDSLLKSIALPEIRGSKKNDGIKILKDNNLNARIEGDGEYISDISPKPGYMVKEGAEIIVYTSDQSDSDNTVAVPDLNGYSVEKATELLESLGLKIEIQGEGVVSEQSIAPGQHVNKGTVITVHLQIIAD